MSEGSDKKHNIQSSKTSVMVAIVAGIVLLGVIGFVAYKVRKSLSKDRPEEVVVDSSSNNLPKQRNGIAASDKQKLLETDSLKMVNLYARFFKKDTIPSIYPKFLVEAFTGYKFGDYIYIKKLDLAAIPETMETIEGSKKDSIVQLGHYYKGMSGILTNDTAFAMEHLHWASAHASIGDFSVRAKWYMALTYIKSMESTKAVSLLETITTNNKSAYYRELAKTLLHELKKE